MILTITPNAAVDVTIRVDSVVRGESHRVGPAIRRAGGKGLNVSRVLAHMHEATHAVAAVGEADLAFFDSDLGEVPRTLISIADARTRRSTAIVEESGAATLFNEAGSPMPAEAWSDVLAAATRLLPAVRCVVISGSTPPGFAPERLSALFALAHQMGIPVLADLSGPDLLLAADLGAALLKPNRRELTEATGITEPMEAAAVLVERGAGAVLVSLGEEGMVLVAGPSGRCVRGRGRVVIGNPTGAGDAAVASLAGHLAESNTQPHELVARALAWSAAAVAAPEAGTLGHDIDTLLDDIIVHDIRRLV